MDAPKVLEIFDIGQKLTCTREAVSRNDWRSQTSRRCMGGKCLCSSKNSSHYVKACKWSLWLSHVQSFACSHKCITVLLYYSSLWFCIFRHISVSFIRVGQKLHRCAQDWLWIKTISKLPHGRDIMIGDVWRRLCNKVSTVVSNAMHVF